MMAQGMACWGALCLLDNRVPAWLTTASADNYSTLCAAAVLYAGWPWAPRRDTVLCA
jgi:hypothetical protein